MVNILLKLKNILTELILSIETIIKIGLLSKFYVKIKKITGTKKKIIIIANGPSVKDFKLSSFNNSNFDFLTVNHSTSTEIFEQVKPQYHIINAPELWKNDVSDYYINARQNLFHQLKEKVTWPLILLIPYGAKKFHFWQDIISSNKNIAVIYYNSTPVEGVKTLNHFWFRHNMGMPRPHNVVIPSLMLLINMGYETIYLVGVDHSWLNEINVTLNNEVLVCQKHFYDENEAKSKTMTATGIGSRKLHEVLHKFYLTFKGYFEIEEYAKQEKVQIFNATKDSYIDAFERKTLQNDL